MARLGLQRQAEFEITLEFGGDLGVISDGSPVFCDEHGLRGVQAHHRADLAGVKSLKQRRYNAFGLSRECIGLGHQGSPVCDRNRGCKLPSASATWSVCGALLDRPPLICAFAAIAITAEIPTKLIPTTLPVLMTPFLIRTC